MTMITFKFNENNNLHDDISIYFDFSDKKLIGDTYAFMGNPEDQTYTDIINRIISYYQKSFKIIINLPINRTYFWFYFIFDETEEGISITNIDDKVFEINFIIKCKYSEGDEYIFEKDSIFTEKEKFVNSMKQSLNHPRICDAGLNE